MISWVHRRVEGVLFVFAPSLRSLITYTVTMSAWISDETFNLAPRAYGWKECRWCCRAARGLTKALIRHFVGPAISRCKIQWLRGDLRSTSAGKSSDVPFKGSRKNGAKASVCAAMGSRCSFPAQRVENEGRACGRLTTPAVTIYTGCKSKMA